LLLRQCFAKLYARAFLNGTCIANIVLKTNKTVCLFFFRFVKGTTDRVQMKGNCVVSGPSLVAET